MPTLTEMIGAQAVQDNSKTALDGIDAGLKTGMQLAQVKEQVASQKQDQAIKKEALAQQQMNGLGNKLRAAAFSTDKSIFNSRLQQAKAYADQANIPFNDQAFKDLYDNEQTRLVLKNGISGVMSGKTPANPEEFLGLVGSQEGLYNWAESGITKNAGEENKRDRDMAILQAKLDNAEKLAGLKGAATQTVHDDKKAKQDRDFATKFIDTFNATPAVRKFDDRLGAADSADELLRINNPISGEAAKTAVARLSGEVGALTDSDVNRFGGSKALSDKLSSIGKQAYDGKLTAENRQYLSEVVGAYRKSLTNSKAAYAKKYVKQKANAGLVDEADAINWVLPEMGTQKESAPAQGAGGGGADSVTAFYNVLPAKFDSAKAIMAIEGKIKRKLTAEEKVMFAKGQK